MIMRIKELREAAKISQRQLAEEMGTQQNGVSNWELEVSLPRTRDLPQLARILGVSISDLFATEEGGDTA